MSNDRINTSKIVLSKHNSNNNGTHAHFPFELRGQIYLVTFDLRRNNILVSAHLHGARRLVPQDCTGEQSAQTHTCGESQNIRIFAEFLIQNKTTTLFLSSSLTVFEPKFDQKNHVGQWGLFWRRGRKAKVPANAQVFVFWWWTKIS